ncbi:hypothetical protein DFH29DRAFT_880323 [Suillus ampliporus]|nr:hypothetical protein DFH29DRAFT_880323 [Suillus ampliporus]
MPHRSVDAFICILSRMLKCKIFRNCKANSWLIDLKGYLGVSRELQACQHQWQHVDALGELGQVEKDLEMVNAAEKSLRWVEEDPEMVNALVKSLHWVEEDPEMVNALVKSLCWVEEALEMVNAAGPQHLYHLLTFHDQDKPLSFDEPLLWLLEQLVS